MYCFLFGLIYVWWLMHLCPAWSYISNSALIFWNVYICGLGVNHGNMGGLLTVCTIAHRTIKPLKPWQTLCALLLSTKKHFFFFFFYAAIKLKIMSKSSCHSLQENVVHPSKDKANMFPGTISKAPNCPSLNIDIQFLITVLGTSSEKPVSSKLTVKII